ncbi:hypothetical protein SAMN04487980_102885 [Streptomyces sp. cf124]|nr:hypothetical protein SAMN04487980_102885 [Streptomyces sp. cf124]
MDDWFGGWCELPDDNTLTDADVLRDALRHPYVTVGQTSSSVQFLCSTDEFHSRPSDPAQGEIRDYPPRRVEHRPR